MNSQPSLYDRTSFIDLTGFEDERIILTADDRRVMQEIFEYLAAAPGPVPSREIEERFNACGAQVRAHVHCLRLARVPVASSGKGYWLARSRADLATTIEHLRSRRNSMDALISALEEAAL